MKFAPVLLCGVMSLANVGRGAELSVAKLEEAPPSDAVSPAIAAQLSPTGFKVTSGTSRTVCDVWLAKEWPVKPGFQPSISVTYPFEMGQLLGVIRYKRKGADFRDQELASGVYTVRYAQQPVDGSHVGTSDTRDFVLLLKAEQDTKVATPSKEDLFKMSVEAAGTTHPAMLCLLAADGNTTEPKVEHEESRDLWILRVSGKQNVDGKVSDLPLGLVVVGHAAE